MEGYEGGYSSTQETVTFTVECPHCMDRMTVEKPFMRMGKITITKTVRCPKCNDPR